MTAAELCEPLLLYVCRLNRAARKGGQPNEREVRREITALLAELRSKRTSAPELTSAQFDKLEMALIFFVDSMIAESKLAFASAWHADRIAFEQNELAGDEKFFDVLDEFLGDRSEGATQCVAVLYTCMGLGFTGWYAGQPEEIKSKMLECAARLRGQMDKDDSERICQPAYEHTDTRDLIEPPGAKLLGVTIAFLGLLAVLFIASWVLYDQFTSDLGQALSDIRQPDDAITQQEAR
ncbi:MAG: DotU family type IV/VI secretion system protein [Phycisphaerales bacterium]